MPYKVRKVKCKNSKGKTGKYILTKKGDNKKISCHTSKEKANAAVRARWANESDLSLIAELIYVKLLNEISYNKRKYSGSHPEESYQYGWPEFDESELDKEGLTTWHKDREWTKQYLKSIGLL
jgi:hypothetical protein